MSGKQGQERRVTLADVAKRAGVSPALVSIVMRDIPGASAESRRRILTVAHELGYRPDARARSLAGSKARLIGVLFGRAGRFHLELIDGLYAAAEAQGWNLVLSALTESRDEQRALDTLHDFRFDGLVMLGPQVPQPILAGRLPTVVVGWHVDHPDVDVVRTSDELGMARAVQHLVDLGHSRIAHLQGGPGLIALARRDAYVDAMRVRSLGSHIQVVPCDGEDQIDGQRATRTIMAGGQDLPTALVAFNDDIAAAAISVLAQQGIDVPGDMSVVGFDDGALARTSGIDLTSVRQVPHEMARRAVDRIVERSAGEQVQEREIVFDPHLVVRSTSGPTARHEPDTAAELVADLGVADRAGGTSGKG